MSYSPEIQARINAKAAANRPGGGPSFPMPRLTHNGDSGKWEVQELEGDKNAKEKTDFKTDGGKWAGVVLRVAWMCQTKYKEGSTSMKFTREFQDFTNEKIYLLKRNFGMENFKAEELRSYNNYQDFKAATTLKDEDGNVTGQAYDLKVVLYVWHPERKQVVKLALGGSSRSEWFEYTKNRSSNDPELLSTPWKVSQPQCEILEQVLTEFFDASKTTPKGLQYHRVGFRAVRALSNDEVAEALNVSDKLQAWAQEWKQIQEKKQAEAAIKAQDTVMRTQPAEQAASYAAPAPSRPLTTTDVVNAFGGQVVEEDEIKTEDIPF